MRGIRHEMRGRNRPLRAEKQKDPSSDEFTAIERHFSIRRCALKKHVYVRQSVLLYVRRAERSLKIENSSYRCDKMIE